ncbi:MAG: hypothetical protein K2N74_03670 [Clostridiales bacterium]|nr:hypothetical protein [Clostridiales bacterium]
MKVGQFFKKLFTVNIWLKVGMFVLAFFLTVAVGAAAGTAYEDTNESEETAIVSEFHS